MGARRWSAVLAATAATGALLASAGPAATAPQVVNGRVVFAGTDFEAGTYGDIFTMAADGSDVVRVTEPGPVDEFAPEYSPDGRQIAFVSDRDSYSNIYTMAADGSGPLRLTETSFSDGGDFQPTWTPDSMGVVFVSTRDQNLADNGGAELYRMDADGSDEVRLTNTASNVDDLEPQVSPDGTRIAFVSDRPNPDQDFTDLFVMGSDGGNVTQLTFDAPIDENGFGSFADHPAWSPDSSRLLFDSDRSGDSEIWLINADGTGLTNLTNHPTTDLEPAWSPDGSQITWTGTRSGQDDVWVMDAPAPTARADAEPTNLTPAEDVAGGASDWQRRLTCTVLGTSGPDRLVGTPVRDVICGRGGDDELLGMRSADELRGGRGADLLLPGRGADWAYGGRGADRIELADGVEANDLARGGPSGDECTADVEDLAFSCR